VDRRRRDLVASIFALRVVAILRRIPPGRVTTYGAIACMAGRPGAARAVGTIMRLAREPGLPYHRVIAAGGRVGGYGSNPHLKPALLRAEGHVIRGRRLVGFAASMWPADAAGTAGRARRPNAGGNRQRRERKPRRRA
jgi:O-6-methylguanine DNA methyltransferase